VGAQNLGAFSLHPLKAFGGCGDGGFISVQSPEMAERLRRLRNHGLEDRDHCADLGANSRLDTVQAAMLLVKLDAFDRLLARRREHAEAYRRALGGVVRLPPEHPDACASYGAFVVRHPRRDDLMSALRDRGVESKVHYPIAIHQQRAYRQGLTPSLPVTERVVSEILSLPVRASLTVTERESVVEAVRHSVEVFDR